MACDCETKFFIDDFRNCELKSVRMYVNADDNTIRLALTYEYETDDGKYELILPDISTNICSDSLPRIEHILTKDRLIAIWKHNPPVDLEFEHKVKIASTKGE